MIVKVYPHSCMCASTPRCGALAELSVPGNKQKKNLSGLDVHVTAGKPRKTCFLECYVGF